MKTIRWGILGCGNVTELKSGPAYQKVEGFELKAVMRRNKDLAKDYAARHHIEKHYSNADELINDPEIDAIYIATPPNSHLYYALKVAKANKICCIEKPITPHYHESHQITEAFAQKQLPLFVAYYRRSLPRFEHIKQWIDNNNIGDIRHIQWFLSKAPSEVDITGKPNWRTDAQIAPAGYFDDLASHGIDLFIHLLGNIKEANGISLNQQGLYSAKDAVTGSWLHENGITGSGSWNFGCDRREDKVEIFGSKGKISFSVFDNEALVIDRKGKTEEVFIENPPNIQLYHVRNMKRQLIDRNFQHPSTGESAAHTSWVMDKILGKI